MSLKRQGIICGYGISLYSPDELAVLIERYHFDVIQAPASVVDRRFKISGWLSHLSSLSMEFQARSIFLQGLLLQSQKKRLIQFQKWTYLWDFWDGWLLDNKLNALEACLNYILFEPGIDRVVIGIDSQKQLANIVKSIDKVSCQVPLDFSCDDEMLLHPYNWSIK